MVIETKMQPLLEWLLGPGWHEGSFFRGLPMVIGFVAAVIAIGWLVSALRGGSVRVARITARVLAGGLVITVLTFIALWLVEILLNVFSRDPDFTGLLGSRLATSVVKACEQLLGVGWYEGTFYHWVLVLAGLTFAGLMINWLIAALRGGPITALRAADRMLAGGLVDVARISPRRVFALGGLAVKESIRRRVVVGFAVFILLLLFAGWFLDPGSSHPGRLYLSFVLTSTSYLVLLLALFLSALSLPGDIKNKTLHTVVTKPVRPSEIVLGRIVGFGAVGTALLVIMGVANYVLVVRGLLHYHDLTEADVEEIERSWNEPVHRGAAQGPLELVISQEDRHQHDLLVRRDFAESSLRELKAELAQTDRLKAEQNLRDKGWLKTKTGWLKIGRLKTETMQDHWHEFSYSISADENGNRLQSKIESESGSPQGMLISRVPVYGKLRFKDSAGRDADKGINVGDEWTYRSFIAGGTDAAAVWTFEGITEGNFPKSRFPRGLPLEMTLEVYRTHKGKTDDPAGIPGIPGILSVRTTTDQIVQLERSLRQAKRQRDRYQLDEEASETSAQARRERARHQQEVEQIQARLDRLRAALPPRIEVKIFTAREVIDQHYIPPQLETPDGDKLDLFEDVAPEGKLEVWLQCAEPAMYFGVAQADVYFRARDASFPLNLAKGYFGIWLQMMLVTGIGVTYSTFLSGPISLLATLGTLVGGFFRPFMSELGAGDLLGGGPVESLIRLLTQQNMISPMEPGARTRVAQMVDNLLEPALGAAAAVLPEFGRFSFAGYVAYGFDISSGEISKCLLQALAFLVPVFVAAYFFLKTREVAR